MGDNDVSQTLRDELKAFVDQMTETRPNETVFAHLYQGDDLKAGAIRLSQHNFRPFPLAEGADVFSDHVKVFGRESTLLTWLVKWCRFCPRSDRHLIVISAVKQPERSLACETDDRAAGFPTTRITISNEMREALCSASLAVSYLENNLQQHSPSADRVYRDLFVAARGKALAGMDADSKVQLRRMAKVLAPSPTLSLQDGEYYDLLMLGALQSALVFSPLSSVDARESDSITAYVTDADEEEPLWITLRMPVSAQDHVMWFSEQANRRQKAWKKAAVALTEEDPSQFAHRLWNRILEDPFDAIDLCKFHLKREFAVRRFDPWRLLLVCWMVAIIDRLRGELHESQRLDFYLAAGDRSQVLDLPSFVLRQLGQSTGSVALPKRDDRRSERGLSQLVDQAARAIGRLNYPWFQDGRYALFWNAAFPADVPVGLLEVRHSTWERWESRLELFGFDYANTQPDAVSPTPNTPPLGEAQKRVWVSERPNLIVAHCRSDGRAGLSIGAGKVLAAAPGETHWELSSRMGRREWLENWFDGEPAQKRVLANVLLRIAEDPRRGCIMVFPHHHTFSPMGMGEVWSPHPTVRVIPEYEEDLIALCSMDGATVVTKSEQGELGLKYRALVGAYNTTANDEILKLLTVAASPLQGMGSRRWSGALTATSREVKIVVVVSQDGDIHLWEKKEGRLRLHYLKLGEAQASVWDPATSRFAG